MVAVDEATMEGRIVDYDLWHSFSQHIAIKDSNNIYVLEESEGSRQTQITKKTASNLNGTTIPVLEYGGERTSAWSIATYATASSIQVSGSNVLAVGESIDQSRYDDDSYTKAYNIYLTKTPLDSFTSESTTLTWMTSDNTTKGYNDIYLTKISDNRFLLLWEKAEKETSIAGENDFDSMSSHVLHYVFLNGAGEKISEEFTAPAAISECEPIVKNGNVVFYASDGTSLAFYQINGQSGKLDKTCFFPAGDQAVWSFDDGVLTITGKGALYDSLSSGFSALQSRITKNCP